MQVWVIVYGKGIAESDSRVYDYAYKSEWDAQLAALALKRQGFAACMYPVTVAHT